jgi:7-keto-8-aminopelargonate synthetase-like enzyme
VHDFQWVKAIESNFFLIVDDSHGIGVVGENGNGIFSQIPDVQGIKKLVIASMGKALGMPAGMVLGSKETIKELQQSTFYSGASPALPAYLYAFLRAKNIYQTQQQKLKENIAFFSSQIAGYQLFNFTQDYPVFRTHKNDLYQKLLSEKILISSFPYPTPDSELITRIVLSSLHTKDDLNYLIETLIR